MGLSQPRATKLCDVVDTLEGRGVIRSDLGKLEKWDCVNLLKLNNTKCKVLHLSQGNSKLRYRLGSEWIERSPEESDLEVLENERLDITQQCALRDGKVNFVLGCIQSNVPSRVSERLLPFYSALVKPHLGYCVQLCGLQHNKDIDLLKQV